MKLDRDFLKTGKAQEKTRGEESNKVICDEVQAPVSLPRKEEGPPKYRFEYDPNLICPTQLTEKDKIYDLTVGYCESFNVKVGLHLADAMAHRAAGERILSPREADICARGKVSLDNEFFWESLFISNGYLQEGELAFRLNPWEIRTRYNNGLNWKKTAREKASQVQKIKGDAILIQLLQTLDAYKLPPYPSESGIGFSRELLKPEFLSWEQYDVIRSGFKTGTEEHQKELLT